MKRRSKAPSATEKAAHDRFREQVGAGPCWLKRAMPGHRCEGPVDNHHVLSAQYLKRKFLPLRRTDEARYWSQVHDPRNGLPICRWGDNGHEGITNRSTPLPWEVLPERVLEFAEEHGLTQRLETECPREVEIWGFGRAA